MATSTLPKSLNLSSVKPTIVPAYTRRVESIATNAQSFGENGIANIVLDTSTPGSFLDPTQSLLQFDIAITNTNPYIDYINLSSCGMAAIIQEMRIICQGTPLEEMLDYNMMFEMFMDMDGQAQEEFKLYMENSWRAPVGPGQSDVNFVKPPMVDREGIIMCPNTINMFGDANSACTHNEDGQISIDQPDSVSVATAYAGMPGTTTANQKGLNYAGTAGGGYKLNEQRGPSDTSTTYGDTATKSSISNIGTSNNNQGGNYVHLWETGTNKWTGSSAPGNIRAQTWTNRIDNTYVTWPSTIRPEPLIKNEARQRLEADSKKYRVQDYLAFLANVKNIPVGITPSKSFIATDDALNRAGTSAASTPQTTGETKFSNWNFSTVAASATTNHMTPVATTISYTVTLPIFSGLIGLWAEKMFPTMLIGPGSFYLQLKFAKASHAFQCAMDPCRRVFGSYRDYVPNCGLVNYYATEFRGQALAASKVSALPSNTGASTWMALTTAGTCGHDFAWNGIVGMYPPTASAATFAKSTANGYRSNLIANAQDTTILGIGASGTDYQANIVGQGEGCTTGNAKPQYVPRATPWLFGGNGFLNDVVYSGATVGGVTYSGSAIVRERNVCFGTHLPASTPQVRRTRANTNSSLGSTSGTNYDAVPTYTVSNLKYVGQQFVLPDDVVSSIVRQASSSDVSLHAQSVRSYRAILANSSTQNIILPIKVSSANSLWMIFQNQNMIENTNYLGMTRTCPFTAYKWTPSSKFVGSDTPPSVISLPAINPFSIQLRIGNELLPQQPMSCVQHVVTELVRSIHGMSTDSTNLEFTASLRGPKFKNNTGAGDNDKNVLTDYNVMKNNDFLTAYIPVEALDDQTITNNPQFLDYHALANNNAGTITPTPYAAWKDFNDRGTYVLPEYLPPVSKFLLGFDLDTFPGNSDMARSGRYLGNAPLTLQMSNTYAPTISSTSGTTNDTIIATAVVLHDIRFSIMAGGQVLSYY